MIMKLKCGDVFFVHENVTWLQKGINLVQRIHDLWDKDPSEDSETPHTGFVKDEDGLTFESKFKIGTHSMEDYTGAHLMIYRNVLMTQEKFDKGLRCVSYHEGQIYPVHRLFLHLAPGIARWFAPLPKPVCSELVAKFLYYAGLRRAKWWGTDVDMLLDEIRDDTDWECIWDGTWR